MEMEQLWRHHWLDQTTDLPDYRLAAVRGISKEKASVIREVLDKHFQT
jgi:hypothetical protein